MSQEEQLKYIASIVRALVTSRKPPVELKFVLKDYCDVEGSQLPFKQMGYSSPLSLLQATGEFTCRNFNGEICIFANFSPKTAHIESMIKFQKKGKNGRASLNFPRPLARKIGGFPQKSNYPYKHYSGGSGHRSSLSSYQKHNTNLGRWPPSLAPSYPSARNTGPPANTTFNSNNGYIAQKKVVAAPNGVLEATLKELKKKTAEFQLLREKYNKLELEAKKLKESSCNEEVKGDKEKQQKKLKEQYEQNYTLNQMASVNSGKTVMQSSASVVKSPLEQEQQQQRQVAKRNNVPYSTNNNKDQYNSNNNNTNNNDSKQFDLRDKLKEKYKRILEENKKKAEDVEQQQQNQKQLPTKNKVVEKISNKTATNTNTNTNTTTNTNSSSYKTMRPILGQTSKPSPPSSAASTPSPSSSAASTPSPSSTTHKNVMNTQKQQQKSSPHYIMGSTNGHGNGQGQQTNSSASASVSLLLPTPPNSNEKVKPSVQPSSVQNRLKINKIINIAAPPTPGKKHQHKHNDEYCDAYNKCFIPETFSQIEKNRATQNSSAPFIFDSSDAVNSLLKYCHARGFREPEYKFYQEKDRYHCRVKISEQIYSCYPLELPDKKSAKMRTAIIAVEKLRDIESRNFLPKCHFTEKQFEMEIFEKMKNHPHGVVTKDMSVWFERTFQQQMPKNWWSVLLNSSKFKMESLCLTENSIIYANTDVIDGFETPDNKFSGTGTTILTPPETPLSIPSTIIELNLPLPPIELPWSNKHWSLLITSCRSTIEIWARLFGDDYSEPYYNMTDDMQKLMANRKLMNPVLNVEKDQIYIAEHATHGWQRVQLEDFDKTKSICNCFFVDCGDSEAIPLGELYQCTSHFRCLPAQAICLSVYGLHEYANHPYAYRVLYETLYDKSLIASIDTSQEVYESTGGTVRGYLEKDGITRHGCIEVILYDTSLPNEDIDLCEVLIQQMDVPPPKLKADLKSVPVVVTHVNDNGDLYLIAPDENINYVQHLISKIVASNFQRDQHQVIYSDLNPDTIFLVCDNISNPRGETTWYRGMLTEKPHSPEDEAFDIYYVDYGRIHSTHISKIFRLDLLSMALSKFPPQAIRACLHDVPPMTMTTVARLRGLLPPNTDALVKVNGIEKDDSSYEIPMITLFTIGQTGAYCAVNDTLRIEHELESSKQTVEAATSNINCLDSSRSGGLLVRSDSHSSSQSMGSSNNSVIELTHSIHNLLASNKVYMLKPIKEFEAIPALNAFFEIRVSYSANPMFFVVQPYKEYSQQLVRLMRELQEYCENCKDYVPTDSIILGEAYAIKNKDDFYHRAIALQNFGAMVRVKYVDFGDEAAVRSTQLKVLPPKFRQLPKMAVNAKLYGIKSINDEWSVDDCGRFRELTLGKKLIAIVHKVSYPDMDAQKAALLTLELFDTTTSVDIRIHELLIEEKRGILDKEAST